LVNFTLPPTDSNGYLFDYTTWNENIAVQLAIIENINLTAEHWTIIHFVRNFYIEYKNTPPLRVLVALLKNKHDIDQNTSHYLHTLFLGEPALKISKLAGLPRPTRCI